jgi:hypothetical protein
MAVSAAGATLLPSNPGDSSFFRSLRMAASASPGICTGIGKSKGKFNNIYLYSILYCIFIYIYLQFTVYLLIYIYSGRNIGEHGGLWRELTPQHQGRII